MAIYSIIWQIIKVLNGLKYCQAPANLHIPLIVPQELLNNPIFGASISQVINDPKRKTNFNWRC
jgi:hypothetical protein